jgi:uncharacterized protein (DUF433 family)
VSKRLEHLRYEVPLYTVAEAARAVDVPTSTFATWAKGYLRRSESGRDVRGGPVVTAIAARGGEPSIPFIGLAEGLVLSAVRHSGVPMQRIRPALAKLERELGLPHALASKRLYTDGAELLFDFGSSNDEASPFIKQLVVVRNGQTVFHEVIADYLRRIEYDRTDGYARLIRVPAYQSDVVCDPTRSFGSPIFARGGARVSDVLDRFQAGEPLDDLSLDFGVPAADLEDALRVASRRAA